MQQPQHPEAVEKILTAVAEASGVSRRELLDISQRPAHVHTARAIAFFLMREAGMRERQIADVFGVSEGSDTIRRGIRRTRDRMVAGGFTLTLVRSLASQCDVYLGPKCPACNRPVQEQAA